MESPTEAAPLRQQQMIAEAQSEETSTARLDGLSKERFMAVKRLVARHPNASAEALTRVFDAAPDDVLRNPAWMLHLIADPGLFDQLSEFALTQTANWSSCPASFVKWACRHAEESVLWRLVLNRHLRPELRARAACHLPAEAVERLGKVHLAGAVPPALVFLCDLFKGAHGPEEVSTEDLKSLVSWGPRGTEAVADWAHTPPEVLAVLAHHPSSTIREKVAGHPRADEATLTPLASDPLASVRAIAGKGLKALKRTPQVSAAEAAKPKRKKPAKKKAPQKAAPKLTPAEEFAAQLAEEAEEVAEERPRRRGGLFGRRRSQPDEG